MQGTELWARSVPTPLQEHKTGNTGSTSLPPLHYPTLRAELTASRSPADHTARALRPFRTPPFATGAVSTPVLHLKASSVDCLEDTQQQQRGQLTVSSASPSIRSRYQAPPRGSREPGRAKDDCRAGKCVPPAARDPGGRVHQPPTPHPPPPRSARSGSEPFSSRRFLGSQSVPGPQG